MRVVLIGQAAFAEKVLDGLRARGQTVAAVYCPPDAGSRVDPVKARAAAAGIPVRQHKSLKSPAVREEMLGYEADLAVLAYVTQIVPAGVFAAPRRGSICFHPSLLPAYRGGSAINWQIIKGESETGVTIFWVDAGIDTGPILLQRKAEIGADDTAGSLYYRTLFPLGVEAVLDAVDQIEKGTAPRLPQDETRATYDPLCRDEHARIDWSRPVGEVYNLIRGCDPQPGAYALLGGEKLRLYDARALPGGVYRPGLVEEISGAGLIAGATGGAIRVERVRFANRKMSAAEFAAAHGLKIGTALE